MEADRHLSDLIARQVQPLALEIARTRQESSSIDGNYSYGSDDVCGDVVLQVLHRLRELRSHPQALSIANLRVTWRQSRTTRARCSYEGSIRKGSGYKIGCGTS